MRLNNSTNGKANQVEGGAEDQSIAAQDLDLGLLVQNSITIKDVAQRKGSRSQTAAEAVQALKIGNARFFSGYQLPQDFSALKRRSQIVMQTLLLSFLAVQIVGFRRRLFTLNSQATYL